MKKKKFTEKNKILVKIIHIFYLQNIFFSNSFAIFEKPHMAAFEAVLVIIEKLTLTLIKNFMNLMNN